MSNEPLDKKWESFGWDVIEVDGNDIAELVQVFHSIPKTEGKPTIILANTIKGKGISFAENEAGWHHHVPSQEEYELAMKELSKRLEVLA